MARSPLASVREAVRMALGGVSARSITSVNSPFSQFTQFNMDGLAGSTNTGIAVSQERSLQLVVVWACISLISDTISTLPLDTFTGSSGTAVPVSNPKWLDRPNTDQTRQEFIQTLVVSALVDGNAFFYTLRDPNGAIIELIPIHPKRVGVIYNRYTGRRTYYVDGQEVDPFDLRHVPGLTMPGDARGRSPIDAARQAIGLGLATEEYGARFFKQGATMSGVIQVPQGLDNDQAAMMAKSFQAKHSGLRASHTPGVLTGGATWQPITIPNDQAQFLQTRSYQTSEIARLYRVPPHLVGEVDKTTSWGTGIEEQNRAFVQYTLMPWLTRFETAFSDLMPRPRYVKFNLDALLRGSTKDRYDAYAVGLQNKFLTPNEVRELEDRSPLDGGDVPANPMLSDSPAAPSSQTPPKENQ